jgi:myo-inositol catabolism protein IolC
MSLIHYSINRPLKNITKSWWIGVSEEGLPGIRPIAFIHPSKEADKRLFTAVMENIINQRA